MTKTEVHPGWTDHPIVSHAIDRHPDLDAISVLCDTLQIMTDLEDRFPGSTYAEIFSIGNSSNDDALNRRHVGTLRAAGVEEARIFELLPSLRADTALEVPTVEQMEDTRSGLSWTQLVAKYGKYRGALLAAARKSITDRELKALDLLDRGFTLSQIQRTWGISHPTTRKGHVKRYYQRWLKVQS